MFCCASVVSLMHVVCVFEQHAVECVRVYLRTAIPYIGFGKVAAGQLGVGRKVKIVLASKSEQEFFILDV